MYCVFSLESPHRGDSNKNTLHTFMFKKLENISLLYLLIWRYDKHLITQTTAVWNIFSWFQRCLSHCSTVCKIFPGSTVKPTHVVTSIKGSPVFSSHLFWIPCTKIQCKWISIKGSPVLCSLLLGFPWVTT